jgi:hypothetical protein
MALDVIPTPIRHTAVVQYLEKLDQRGEVYSLLATVRSPHKLELELNRDGAEDALKITLNVDGTWFAEHVIVVGERL